MENDNVISIKERLGRAEIKIQKLESELYCLKYELKNFLNKENTEQALKYVSEFEIRYI